MTTFTSSRGTTFTSKKAGEGKYFIKRVKYYVYSFGGSFGIDAELFETKVKDKHAGIRFSVPEDLINYRTGKVVCEAGEYLIDLDKFQAKAVKAELNQKHGEQYFIAVSDLRVE